MQHAASRLLAAVAFAVLFAGPAVADEPKPVDLSDLKDAVKAASKRGENVDTVAEALAAVEKLVAKGWTAPKAGEAPVELAALRDAVETAARKGENVEAIRKELEAVEKALVGKTLTAVKPELPPLGTPKPDPVPEFPRRGGLVIRGGGVIIMNGGFGGRRGGFQSVTVNNDQFTIKSGNGDVRYELSGQIGVDAVKIVITDGEKKIEADEVKKVPEEYRPTVERLLKMVGR